MKLTYIVKVSITEFHSGKVTNTEKFDTKFHAKNPIIARQKAIERFMSYIDIFEEAKNHEEISSSIVSFFEKKVKKYKIVVISLELADGKKRHELFGSSFDSFQERIDALQEELSLYLENEFEINGIQKIKIENENMYFLPNSIIKFSNGEIIKS